MIWDTAAVGVGWKVLIGLYIILWSREVYRDGPKSCLPQKYHKYRNKIEKYHNNIMIKDNKLNLFP